MASCPVLVVDDDPNILDMVEELLSGEGYLVQTAINGQVSPSSFIDLYSIKVNNPNNYSIPRRIRLGVTFDF